MNGPYDDFVALPIATNASRFEAIRINENRNDYLAKGAKGEPVFLLHDASEPRYSPSLQLRHVTAEFHATCRVRASREEFEGQFCVVVCDAEVPELHELFVLCFVAATKELPDECGCRDLEACLIGLRDLFRAFGAPGTREVFGLWAELFVISRSGDVSRAVAMWRSEASDRYDFSGKGAVLEVKATSKSIRAHSFSLEQLEVPTGKEGVVASILLQPLTGGVGVIDLARQIEKKLLSNIELRKKLWTNVASALGSDFCDKLDRAFDEAYSERSLVTYEMTDVPKPDRPTDPRVSSVRFVSDLTSVHTSLPGSPLSCLRRIFVDPGSCEH